MRGGSYVTLPAERVRALATATIASIDEERERRLAAFVARTRRGWWERLMVRIRGERTDEQIVEAEARGRMSNAVYLAEIYAWGDYDRAEALLSMCDAGEPITVSARDWEAIS